MDFRLRGNDGFTVMGRERLPQHGDAANFRTSLERLQMPVFTVTGDVDPFLHVSLAKGETIYCESDAMVMMEATLDLKGKMKGGLGSALMRTFANGESFFQQHIEAVRGGGDCLLSPTLPGAMQIVDVGPSNYIISDGGPNPYRYRVRPPSLINLTVLEDMCLGQMIADVVIILGSVDIVLGEVDR